MADPPSGAAQNTMMNALVGDTSEKDAKYEISALDHAHFERTFFKDLDDPEYIPAETGHFTWTVSGVRGIPEQPNLETIMKSPSVQIGGHSWSIKFFPKGNNTDHYSVYLECNPVKKSSAAASVLQHPNSRSMTAETTSSNSVHEGSSHEPAGAVAGANMVQDEAAVVVQDVSGPAARPESDQLKVVWEENGPPKVWSVAAQFGVVMFNPNDPRVYSCSGNHHRFSNKSHDRGWPRFHGPHTNTHLQENEGRRPILENDTLTFSAYIRRIHDPTGWLWDKTASSAKWNSFQKTGFRAMNADLPTTGQVSGLAAALFSWIMLAPFKRVIFDTPTVDPQETPLQRPKSLMILLQKLLLELQTAREYPPAPVSLLPIVEYFESCGLASLEDIDVVEWYELLRNAILKEINDTDCGLRLRTLFGVDKGDSAASTIPAAPASAQPPNLRFSMTSISSRQAACSSWASNKAILHSLPPLLQIEVDPRQFDDSSREWRKTSRQLKVDEHIDFRHWEPSNCQETRFTLYGFVAQRGVIGSGDYRAVVRPGGPGSNWYANIVSPSGSRVVCMTRKQAMREALGEPTTGATNGVSDAFPYVLLYVRDDMVRDMLRPSLGDAKPPAWVERSLWREAQSRLLDEGLSDFGDGRAVDDDEAVPRETEQASVATKSLEKVLLCLIPMQILGAFHDLGVPDIHDLLESSNARHVKKVAFPVEYTIGQVETLLEPMIKGRGRSRRYFLRQYCAQWTFQLPRVDPLRKLSDIKAQGGVLLFWVEVIPSDNSYSATTPPLSMSELPTIWEEESASSMDTPPYGSSAADDEHISDDKPKAEASQPLSPGQDNGGVSNEQTGASQTHGPAHDDTQMADAGEAVSSGYPATLNDAGSDEEATGSDSQPTCLVFIKVFQPEKQQVGVVGVCRAPLTEKVGDIVRHEAKMATDKAILLWEEVSRGRGRALEPGETLEALGLHTSAMIIVQEKLTDDEEAEIGSKGDCPLVTDYLRSRIAMEKDPFHTSGHVTRNFFGGHQFSGTRSHGLAFGAGTMSYTNGDQYEGDFMADHRHGHGKMRFANGDSYEGQWKRDQQHGEGKMVYAHSGNVYEGTFRDGEQYGAGTMHYKNAQMQKSKCRICLEREVDSVFYDCGHICTCVICGKRLTHCPVCRKRAINVIKIYFSC
ncbi:MAG: hypothetical protein M1817_003717 [Caeruleum heppii]|nr:MAG: hypothetical protein M1817_003717 [Caeruleum heppii]